MANETQNGGDAGNLKKKNGEEMASAEKEKSAKASGKDEKMNAKAQPPRRAPGEKNGEQAAEPADGAKNTEPAPNFPEAECEAKIKELETKLKDADDKYLRAGAEMDNTRKRTAKEMETLRLNVMMDTITPFLQVFDHFSMAVAASSASNNLKSLLDGMKMIQNEFDKAFSELGVEKIDAVGKDFDPNLHEAVSQEASDTVPAGKVIRQWSLGYKTPKRLLKPAMVVVSSGPQQKADE